MLKLKHRVEQDDRNSIVHDPFPKNAAEQLWLLKVVHDGDSSHHVGTAQKRANEQDLHSVDLDHCWIFPTLGRDAMVQRVLVHHGNFPVVDHLVGDVAVDCKAGECHQQAENQNIAQVVEELLFPQIIARVENHWRQKKFEEHVCGKLEAALSLIPIIQPEKI